MRSYEGHIVRLLRDLTDEDCEPVGRRHVLRGCRGIILQQYSEGCFFVEVFDLKGDTIAYCFVQRKDIRMMGKPSVKAQLTSHLPKAGTGGT